MMIDRICKICGKRFFAIKTTQFFCCRRCFKKDFYMRTKIKLQEQHQTPTYPKKYCDFCETMSELNFDPIALPRLFNTWRCPKCGVSNDLIWKNFEKPHSHQIISQILVSMSNEIHQEVMPKYQVYHLPIARPEQGNPSIVTLTCEMLNILDIQKANRKKIIFS